MHGDPAPKEAASHRQETAIEPARQEESIWQEKTEDGGPTVPICDNESLSSSTAGEGEAASHPAHRAAAPGERDSGTGVRAANGQRTGIAAPVPGAAPPVEKDDPFEVSWDGGDADPLCPRSFTLGKKWALVLITSIGAFCVTFTSSIYTPTYDFMAAEFGTTFLQASAGLSVFVLGLALGPFWSPLSEFYGRKPVYIASFTFYIIFTIPAAVAQNTETMIVARFLQGLSGAAFLAVSGGTVGDLFTVDEMQGPMAFFTVCPFNAPSLGPIFGGLIVSYTNWRWCHYLIVIFASIILILIVFVVPETHHPVLLRNKARRLRNSTGDERWRAPIEKTSKSLRKTVGIALLRPVQLLYWEPMVLALNVYSALLLGIIYMFFGAFPLVFRTNHGFNIWQVGLSFLGMFIGLTSAACTYPFWHKIRMSLVRKQGGGKSEPEFRLPSVMVAAFFVPVGLFWFGWTTMATVHWILPIIGSGFFGIGTLLAFNGIYSFLVEAYPLYAASALASNALVRCSFAAAFPLFGNQMYERLGYQWASSLLAFVAVAMMPFPFIFFKYGKKLRARSRFAKKS